MDVTVVVGTYGDERWPTLARARAIPAAEHQAPVIHVHLDTLAKARNEGARQAETEWLCFCDADDELTPGYFEAMAKGQADLRGPTVEYVEPNGQTRRILWPSCALDSGNNFLPIGTLIRRKLFLDVGGFCEWPIYEDWCLWQRCWSAGATIEQIPDAIYRAYVAADGRNERLSQAEREHWRAEIMRHNFPGRA